MKVPYIDSVMVKMPQKLCYPSVVTARIKCVGKLESVLRELQRMTGENFGD